MVGVKALDFDGIIHNSVPYALAALNQTLRDFELDPISLELLRDTFGSDWPQFFARIGIPEEYHACWKAEYQKRYDHAPLGDLIPGSRNLLEALVRNGNGSYIITNEQQDRVDDFFLAHGLERYARNIHPVYGNKTAVLDSLEVTTYVGDTIGDGMACLAAKLKPRFIGVAHDYSYNSPERLYEFKHQHPEHDIVIVESLHEATDLLRKA